MEKRGRELEPAPLLPWKTPSLNSTTSTNRDDLDNTHIHNNNISTVTTEDKGSMTRGLPGCRRRRKQQRSNSERIELISGNPTAPPRVMAPRSFEHQLYITMTRTGHRTAYLCRGVISCFVSRLDGISRFCAIYSLTGMLFTVRGNRSFSRWKSSYSHSRNYVFPFASMSHCIIHFIDSNPLAIIQSIRM